MAVQLFRLKNVPDDEADDIRELLDAHKIEFYETSEGSWAVSMPAIWLQTDTHFTQAKTLIDDYQRKRTRHARAEYAQLKQHGKHTTIWQKIKHKPLKFTLFLCLSILILYLSLGPFIRFGF